MRRIALAAVAMVAAAILGICGCGGGNDPITQDPALIGKWGTLQSGFLSTITFNTNGTTEAFIANPQDQDSPDHQIGTWYTQGDDLALVSAAGKETRMQYSVSGDILVTHDGTITWNRM